MKIRIRKTQNKWVADTKIAKYGDGCVWTAPADSDLYFQFPEHLFEGTWKHTIRLRMGKQLTRKVNGNCGYYQYAVFIEKDMEFAEGGSPPTIIIK